MLITAGVSLIFNLILMQILHQGPGHNHDHGDGGHGHDHGHGHSHGPPKIKKELSEAARESNAKVEEKRSKNINVDAAYLHVLSDILLTIGVCIAAVIIYFFPSATFADPICTVVFSILVFVTCKPILSNCIYVLMEGAPDEIDTEALIQEIQDIHDGIKVHDFHIWQLSRGKYALSAHVATPKNPMGTLQQTTDICKKNYKIDHVTIQIEDMSSKEYDCA